MGKWFIATHTFKMGQSGSYWDMVKSLDLDAWNQGNKDQGFYMHAWLPSTGSVDGSGNITCIWEVSDGKENQLQEFLDSGLVQLNNTVSEIAADVSGPPFKSVFAQ